MIRSVTISFMIEHTFHENILEAKMYLTRDIMLRTA